jgi:transposase
MKAYSLDLREKIVALYDSGGISQRQLAARFCVSVFFVKKLFRQRKNTGSIAPKQRRGWQGSRLTEEMRERLIAAHQEKNDYTLSDLADLIKRDFGVRVSNPTICRALQKANLRYKKS